MTYDDVVSYARTWLHASTMNPNEDNNEDNGEMVEENGQNEEEWNKKFQKAMLSSAALPSSILCASAVLSTVLCGK